MNTVKKCKYTAIFLQHKYADNCLAPEGQYLPADAWPKRPYLGFAE